MTGRIDNKGGAFRAGRALLSLLCLTPALVSLLLRVLLPRVPAFTETVFSRGLFRIVGVPLGWLVSLVPLSFTELAAVLAVPAVMVLAALFARRMRRSEHRAQTVARAARGIGWVLSGALLLYMVMHGANFYRRPVSELMGLDMSAKSGELLKDVCADLAQKASAERETLREDAEGRMILSESLTRTLGQAGDGYRALDDTYPFLWGAVNRAKPVRLSHWWSYTGITGMYFPLLAEANVNIDQPDCDIPATAAHELAHTRGFAQEDECNFFAVLSCMKNPSADFRYSGCLMAYVYCSNALYGYDKELWKEASAYCSEGMLRDLAAQNEYWKQFEGKVQEAATKANNTFIQSQGVDDGVLSYSRVVGLLLAYYQQQGGVSAA